MRRLFVFQGKPGRLVRLMALAAALLGCVLPQTASAAESQGRTVGPLSAESPPAEALRVQPQPLSQTPSTTEPYKVCHPASGKSVECYLVADPKPVKTSSGYALPNGGPLLQGSGVNGGWSAKDLEEAYGIPTSGGEGQTVAIVEAYGDATAESDLAVYRKEYKLEPCEAGCFTKVNQNGEEKNYPKAISKEEIEEEAGWGGETSLDMDMVSAACPHCHILLVEANHSEISALAAAAEEASKWEEAGTKRKATEISNSYGAPETAAECQGNGCSKYLTEYKHPGIPVTASSGDSGYDNSHARAASFPAVSPNVIAVGGTEMAKTENNPRKWEEWVWPYSGSGCSLYESKPAWQSDAGCSKRTDNDVASVAEGVSIYSTPNFGGWTNVGGTSVGAPLVAGIEAHASQTTRGEEGEAFYRHALFDVTSGSNAFAIGDGRCGGTYLCTAQEGYDGPTGWGSPDGPLELATGYRVVTPPATEITTTGATLNGYIDPEGHETTYHFEYGKTTSYGTTVPIPNGNVGSGVVWKSVSQGLMNLARETTYHYRLVATNSTGTIYGGDHTFVTLSWTVEQTPNPESQFSQLSGVSCTSPTSCFAVGGRSPLVERLNGTEWTTPTVPVPTGSTGAALYGISCPSSTFCVGVGEYYKERTLTLAERWNGTEWAIMTAPTAGQRLFSVSCTSSSFCMGVGEEEPHAAAERWNGTEWQVETVPTPTGSILTRLFGVSCASSTFCIGVGEYQTKSEGDFTLAERWNGTEWSIQATLNPSKLAENKLLGVSCSSSTACTAVGSYRSQEIVVNTLAERWNGTEWSVQSTPSPYGEGFQSVLDGVSCYSPTRCVAVGQGGAYYPESGGTDLAESWNGTEWSLQATPALKGLGVPWVQETIALRGVSCSLVPVSCTAVGSQEYIKPVEELPHRITTAEGYAFPGVETKAATSVTATGATLNGTVNPEGKETTYHFEYGKTTSYGTNTTEVNVGSGTSNVEEGKAITGLEQETTYHFRVVAANSDGTTDGADRTFTTTSLPWRISSTPNPSGATASALAGAPFAGGTHISCSSSTACTGVGFYKNGSGIPSTLAERWNGTEWSIQATPNPSGATESYLHGVSCSSSTACTGVGFYKNGSGIPSTLAERWNGTEWSIQATPNPSGATEAFLEDVSCSSSMVCIAVGWYKTSSGPFATLAERWNGTEWSIQSTPNPSGATLSELRGMSCSSSTACTAVGWYKTSSGPYVTLAERWNGTEWSIQSTPNPNGAKLSWIGGVSCPSSSVCTAVGEYNNSSGVTVTLAERWNGTEWSIQSTPNQSGATESVLGGVSCSSSTSCIGVGYDKNSSGTYVTLAERWNGTEWVVLSTPNPTGATENELSGVSCSSSTACTAVGYYRNSSGTEVTLAEIYG
jgi:hypothetical protein